MDTQLPKELVRAWLINRQRRPAPLPDLDEIRQQVGWARSEAPTERLTPERIVIVMALT